MQFLHYFAGICLILVCFSTFSYAFEPDITIDFGGILWSRLEEIPSSIDWEGKELNVSHLNTHNLTAYYETIIYNTTNVTKLIVQEDGNGLEIYEDNTFAVINSLVQNLIKVTSNGIGSAGFYIEESASDRGTILWEKSINEFEIRSTDELNVKTDAETDDYLQFKTPTGIPQIEISGGDRMYIAADSATGVITYWFEDNTHRCYAGWDKSNDNMDIYSTHSIDILASGDTGDHISFQTVGDTPEIVTSGSCNLVIDPDGGTVDFDSSILTTTGSIYAENLSLGGPGPTEVPVGGYGTAKLYINGTDSDETGTPAIQFTADADDYPLAHVFPYTHDNVNLAFDAYHDGGWKSSDAGSNFVLSKFGDNLNVWYDSGTAVGTALSTATALKVAASTGTIILNEDGIATADVRIEGDVDTDLVFVDSSAGRICLKCTNPAALIDLDPTGDEIGLRMISDATTQIPFQLTNQNLFTAYLMSVVGNHDSSTGTGVLIRVDGTGDLLHMAKEAGGANTVWRTQNDGDTIINGGNTLPTHEFHVIGDMNLTGTLYYGALVAQSPSLVRKNHDPYPITCTWANNGDFVVEYVKYNDLGEYERIIEKVDPYSEEWAHKACWEKNEKFDYLDELQQNGTNISFWELDDNTYAMRKYYRKPTIVDIGFDWKAMEANCPGCD